MMMQELSMMMLQEPSRMMSRPVQEPSMMMLQEPPMLMLRRCEDFGMQVRESRRAIPGTVCSSDELGHQCRTEYQGTRILRCNAYASAPFGRNLKRNSYAKTTPSLSSSSPPSSSPLPPPPSPLAPPSARRSRLNRICIMDQWVAENVQNLTCGDWGIGELILLPL